MYKEVAHHDLGGGEEGDIAENAGKPPHVLAFQVASIAVSVYFCGDGVAAGADVGGDIKNGCGTAVFGEADFLTVDVQIEE